MQNCKLRDKASLKVCVQSYRLWLEQISTGQESLFAIPQCFHTLCFLAPLTWTGYLARSYQATDTLYKVLTNIFIPAKFHIGLLSIIILLLFCLHRRFIFDNRLTGEAQRSLFVILNSVAVCLAEFIWNLA